MAKLNFLEYTFYISYVVSVTKKTYEGKDTNDINVASISSLESDTIFFPESNRSEDPDPKVQKLILYLMNINKFNVIDKEGIFKQIDFILNRLLCNYQ